MVFSKSFGYALRAVLYVIVRNEKQSKVRLDEIALELGIPRHFLGKVMNRLVKEEVLVSQKGPNGGFSSSDQTLATTLAKLVEITGDAEGSNTCLLKFQQCNEQNPCPLHYEVEYLNTKWKNVLASTTIQVLLNKRTNGFMQSIGSEAEKNQRDNNYACTSIENK